jgi:hypothetical protein
MMAAAPMTLSSLGLPALTDAPRQADVRCDMTVFLSCSTNWFFSRKGACPAEPVVTRQRSAL